MADTKNFGLKGVGNDIQLGKAGPRINVDTGSIEARNAADGAYVNFRVLTPAVDADAATKLYVDSVAQGLDYKESCQAATTAAGIGTYAAGGGPSGTGQFTSVGATIDGVTLAENDRVLVKDQADAKQNGIYVVTSTTTTLNRATDHDGAGEVSAGNFTFVEAGTVNGNTSWVVIGDGGLTLNTDDIDWALFSTTAELLAGNGLVKNGNTIDLDFSELTSAATIATADELVFQDSGVESVITVANFLADRDIVTATADGVLVRTANDTYASRTLTASAVAGDQGISIVNGNGVSGNPTIGLDITGLGAITTVELADTIVVFDGTNNVEATFTDVVQDLDIPNAITTNGMVTRTGADTYTSRSIAVSAVAGDEGLSIVNGNGVSGNPTIGLDILGQTNLVTDDVDDADELILYHSVAGGTEGVGNYAVTAAKLKTYMNAGTSTTTITEGDSSVAVSDAGSGTITTTVDSTAVITSIAASTSFNHDVIVTAGDTLTLTDLTENDVMVVGTGGLVEDSGGALTFNGTTLGVTGAAQIDNINIDGNTISSTAGVDLLLTPLAGQQLILDTAIIVDNGSMTGITTLGFDGVSFTAVDTAGEFNDNDVTLMTSAAVNDRIESFGYSTTTGTITGTVADNQVAIGTGASSLDSSANFTFDGTTMQITGAANITGDLDVDNVNINGNTISVTDTNGDLVLLPNGTGSIIFNDGAGDPILELNDTVSAVNGLAITAGATGVAPTITTGTGAEADIDIGFLTNGTGVLSVTAGTGNYEDNVTAADDIPNKQYVDDAVASGVGLTGNLDSVTGTVSLTSAATVNIGAATGIPANCTIMSVTLEIDTASDAVTTVTVGDATNGAASYMAATENDPEVLGIYIADGRVANGGGDRQATATVATPGSVGSATCIITFRHA